jgi:2-(3-amino-3-carboxypropyl)histidine synthase
MGYELELDKVAEKIKNLHAKKVCIQLPDGLKPKAKEIKDFIEKNTGAEVLIWLGSCYGACDIPEQVEKLGVELLIQWGHSDFL